MSDRTTIELDIELLTDVCLSTSNRTLGEPETFTCIPGRTLWGTAAALAYRGGMSETEAFRIFHQGGVRILDAVPLVGATRACPVPRSWHRPKDSQELEVHNFALSTVRELKAKQQFKPSGEGWVVPDAAESGARSVVIKTSRSTRTAMDPSGTPRDGLLFGIPVIQAGGRFCTVLSGPSADVEAVVKLLTSNDIRVGRSRNAELGLIKATRRKSPAQALVGASGSRSTVHFLCVSRCLLRDPVTGGPTTLPFPAAFGLDASWTYDEASSFIRTTRIVHFNSKRTRPETDRFALERGTVVTFTSAEPTSLEDLRRVVAGGIGEYRGQGYGEVIVSPSWLTVKCLTVAPAADDLSGVAAQPDDELFKWALKRSQDRKRAVDLYESACAGGDQLRRYGVPPAQWGALHKMAREARFNKRGGTLLKTLFGDIDSAVNTPRHPSIGDRAPKGAGGHLGSGRRKLSHEWKKARQPLLKLCEPYKDDELAVFIEHLAGVCMREALETEARS